MHNSFVVLFVNHKQENCGVYQFFKRMTAPLIQHNWYYIETNQEWEHDHWIQQLHPDVVVYNFYFSGATMPWLTNAKIANQKSRFKQICLYHEGNIDDKGFDLILHQNPLNTDRRYFNLPRPIPSFDSSIHIDNIVPTIGTFGFGLGGKGFTRVVETVIRDFEYARIRMNIPYAHFGDKDGTGARHWANLCYKAVQEHPLIDLVITHDLLPETQLLQFLHQNDINAFLYDDNIGRGISGTLDYALAVRKPIAITRSDQFKHMWNDVHMIEQHTLPEIIAAGTEHLHNYHVQWNNRTLIAAFNEAFTSVLGR